MLSINGYYVRNISLHLILNEFRLNSRQFLSIKLLSTCSLFRRIWESSLRLLREPIENHICGLIASLNNVSLGQFLSSLWATGTKQPGGSCGT